MTFGQFCSHFLCFSIGLSQKNYSFTSISFLLEHVKAVMLQLLLFFFYQRTVVYDIGLGNLNAIGGSHADMLEHLNTGTQSIMRL